MARENDDDVVVSCSDSEEDEENVWTRKSVNQQYQHLFEKIKPILYYQIQPGYKDSDNFPYARLEEFEKELKKTLKLVNVESTQAFIWKNLIRWLVSMKLCFESVTDLIGDNYYNLILTDFMAQYVNYKCQLHSLVTDETEVRLIIDEIMVTLSLVFSGWIPGILMTLLKINVIDDYRLILYPIFRKYLSNKQSACGPYDMIAYLRLILCFRKWKILTHLKEDKELINEIAVGKSVKALRSNVVDLTASAEVDPILPKTVPILMERTRSFIKISSLIEHAAANNQFGTRILLINKSLELEDTIEEFFKQYKQHIFRENPKLMECSRVELQPVLIEDLTRSSEQILPGPSTSSQANSQILNNKNNGKQGTNKAVNQHLSKGCDNCNNLNLSLNNSHNNVENLSHRSNNSNQPQNSRNNNVELRLRNDDVIELDDSEDDDDEEDSNENSRPENPTNRFDRNSTNAPGRFRTGAVNVENRVNEAPSNAAAVVAAVPVDQEAAINNNNVQPPPPAAPAAPAAPAVVNPPIIEKPIQKRRCEHGIVSSTTSFDYSGTPDGVANPELPETTRDANTPISDDDGGFIAPNSFPILQRSSSKVVEEATSSTNEIPKRTQPNVVFSAHVNSHARRSISNSPCSTRNSSPIPDDGVSNVSHSRDAERPTCSRFISETLPKPSIPKRNDISNVTTRKQIKKDAIRSDKIVESSANEMSDSSRLPTCSRYAQVASDHATTSRLEMPINNADKATVPIVDESNSSEINDLLNNISGLLDEYGLESPKDKSAPDKSPSDIAQMLADAYLDDIFTKIQKQRQKFSVPRQGYSLNEPLDDEQNKSQTNTFSIFKNPKHESGLKEQQSIDLILKAHDKAIENFIKSKTQDKAATETVASGSSGKAKTQTEAASENVGKGSSEMAINQDFIEFERMLRESFEFYGVDEKLRPTLTRFMFRKLGGEPKNETEQTKTQHKADPEIVVSRSSEKPSTEKVVKTSCVKPTAQGKASTNTVVKKSSEKPKTQSKAATTTQAKGSSKKLKTQDKVSTDKVLRGSEKTKTKAKGGKSKTQDGASTDKGKESFDKIKTIYESTETVVRGSSEYEVLKQRKQVINKDGIVVATFEKFTEKLINIGMRESKTKTDNGLEKVIEHEKKLNKLKEAETNKNITNKVDSMDESSNIPKEDKFIEDKMKVNESSTLKDDDVNNSDEFKDDKSASINTTNNEDSLNALENLEKKRKPFVEDENINQSMSSTDDEIESPTYEPICPIKCQQNEEKINEMMETTAEKVDENLDKNQQSASNVPDIIDTKSNDKEKLLANEDDSKKTVDSVVVDNSNAFIELDENISAENEGELNNLPNLQKPTIEIEENKQVDENSSNCEKAKEIVTTNQQIEMKSAATDIEDDNLKFEDIINSDHDYVTARIDFIEGTYDNNVDNVHFTSEISMDQISPNQILENIIGNEAITQEIKSNDQEINNKSCSLEEECDSDEDQWIEDVIYDTIPTECYFDNNYDDDGCKLDLHDMKVTQEEHNNQLIEDDILKNGNHSESIDIDINSQDLIDQSNDDKINDEEVPFEMVNEEPINKNEGTIFEKQTFDQEIDEIKSTTREKSFDENEIENIFTVSDAAENIQNNEDMCPAIEQKNETIEEQTENDISQSVFTEKETSLEESATVTEFIGEIGLIANSEDDKELKDQTDIKLNVENKLTVSKEILGDTEDNEEPSFTIDRSDEEIKKPTFGVEEDIESQSVAIEKNLVGTENNSEGVETENIEKMKLPETTQVSDRNEEIIEKQTIGFKETDDCESTTMEKSHGESLSNEIVKPINSQEDTQIEENKDPLNKNIPTDNKNDKAFEVKKSNDCQSITAEKNVENADSVSNAYSEDEAMKLQIEKDDSFETQKVDIEETNECQSSTSEQSFDDSLVSIGTELSDENVVPINNEETTEIRENKDLGNMPSSNDCKDKAVKTTSTDESLTLVDTKLNEKNIKSVVNEDETNKEFYQNNETIEKDIKDNEEQSINDASIDTIPFDDNDVVIENNEDSSPTNKIDASIEKQTTDEKEITENAKTSIDSKIENNENDELFKEETIDIKEIDLDQAEKITSDIEQNTEVSKQPDILTITPEIIENEKDTQNNIIETSYLTKNMSEHLENDIVSSMPAKLSDIEPIRKLRIRIKKQILEQPKKGKQSIEYQIIQEKSKNMLKKKKSSKETKRKEIQKEDKKVKKYQNIDLDPLDITGENVTTLTSGPIEIEKDSSIDYKLKENSDLIDCTENIEAIEEISPDLKIIVDENQSHTEQDEISSEYDKKDPLKIIIPKIIKNTQNIQKNKELNIVNVSNKKLTKKSSLSSTVLILDSEKVIKQEPQQSESNLKNLRVRIAKVDPKPQKPTKSRKRKGNKQKQQNIILEEDDEEEEELKPLILSVNEKVIKPDIKETLINDKLKSEKPKLKVTFQLPGEQVSIKPNNVKELLSEEIFKECSDNNEVKKNDKTITTTTKSSHKRKIDNPKKCKTTTTIVLQPSILSEISFHPVEKPADSKKRTATKKSVEDLTSSLKKNKNNNKSSNETEESYQKCTLSILKPLKDSIQTRPKQAADCSFKITKQTSKEIIVKDSGPNTGKKSAKSVECQTEPKQTIVYKKSPKQDSTKSSDEKSIILQNIVECKQELIRNRNQEVFSQITDKIQENTIIPDSTSQVAKELQKTEDNLLEDESNLSTRVQVEDLEEPSVISDSEIEIANKLSITLESDRDIVYYPSRDSIDDDEIRNITQSNNNTNIVSYNNDNGTPVMDEKTEDESSQHSESTIICLRAIKVPTVDESSQLIAPITTPIPNSIESPLNNVLFKRRPESVWNSPSNKLDGTTIFKPVLVDEECKETTITPFSTEDDKNKELWKKKLGISKNCSPNKEIIKIQPTTTNEDAPQLQTSSSTTNFTKKSCIINPKNRKQTNPRKVKFMLEPKDLSSEDQSQSEYEVDKKLEDQRYFNSQELNVAAILTSFKANAIVSTENKTRITRSTRNTKSQNVVVLDHQKPPPPSELENQLTIFPASSINPLNEELTQQSNIYTDSDSTCKLVIVDEDEKSVTKSKANKKPKSKSISKKRKTKGKSKGKGKGRGRRRRNKSEEEDTETETSETVVEDIKPKKETTKKNEKSLKNNNQSFEESIEHHLNKEKLTPQPLSIVDDVALDKQEDVAAPAKKKIKLSRSSNIEVSKSMNKKEIWLNNLSLRKTSKSLDTQPKEFSAANLSKRVQSEPNLSSSSLNGQFSSIAESKKKLKSLSVSCRDPRRKRKLITDELPNKIISKTEEILKDDQIKAKPNIELHEKEKEIPADQIPSLKVSLLIGGGDGKNMEKLHSPKIFKSKSKFGIHEKEQKPAGGQTPTLKVSLLKSNDEQKMETLNSKEIKSKSIFEFHEEEQKPVEKISSLKVSLFNIDEQKMEKSSSQKEIKNDKLNIGINNSIKQNKETDKLETAANQPKQTKKKLTKTKNQPALVEVPKKAPIILTTVVDKAAPINFLETTPKTHLESIQSVKELEDSNKITSYQIDCVKIDQKVEEKTPIVEEIKNKNTSVDKEVDKTTAIVEKVSDKKSSVDKDEATVSIISSSIIPNTLVNIPNLTEDEKGVQPTPKNAEIENADKSLDQPLSSTIEEQVDKSKLIITSKSITKINEKEATLDAAEMKSSAKIPEEAKQHSSSNSSSDVSSKRNSILNTPTKKEDEVNRVLEQFIENIMGSKLSDVRTPPKRKRPSLDGDQSQQNFSVSVFQRRRSNSTSDLTNTFTNDTIDESETINETDSEILQQPSSSLANNKSENEDNKNAQQLSLSNLEYEFETDQIGFELNAATNQVVAINSSTNKVIKPRQSIDSDKKSEQFEFENQKASVKTSDCMLAGNRGQEDEYYLASCNLTWGPATFDSPDDNNQLFCDQLFGGYPWLINGSENVPNGNGTDASDNPKMYCKNNVAEFNSSVVTVDTIINSAEKIVGNSSVVVKPQLTLSTDKDPSIKNVSIEPSGTCLPEILVNEDKLTTSEHVLNDESKGVIYNTEKSPLTDKIRSKIAANLIENTKKLDKTPDKDNSESKLTCRSKLFWKQSNKKSDNSTSISGLQIDDVKSLSEIDEIFEGKQTTLSKNEINEDQIKSNEIDDLPKKPTLLISNSQTDDLFDRLKNETPINTCLKIAAKSPLKQVSSTKTNEESVETVSIVTSMPSISTPSHSPQIVEILKTKDEPKITISSTIINDQNVLTQQQQQPSKTTTTDEIIKKPIFESTKPSNDLLIQTNNETAIPFKIIVLPEDDGKSSLQKPPRRSRMPRTRDSLEEIVESGPGQKPKKLIIGQNETSLNSSPKISGVSTKSLLGSPKELCEQKNLSPKKPNLTTTAIPVVKTPSVSLEKVKEIHETPQKISLKRFINEDNNIQEPPSKMLCSKLSVSPSSTITNKVESNVFNLKPNVTSTKTESLVGIQKTSHQSQPIPTSTNQLVKPISPALNQKTILIKPVHSPNIPNISSTKPVHSPNISNISSTKPITSLPLINQKHPIVSEHMTKKTVSNSKKPPISPITHFGTPTSTSTPTHSPSQKLSESTFIKLSSQSPKNIRIDSDHHSSTSSIRKPICSTPKPRSTGTTPFGTPSSTSTPSHSPIGQKSIDSTLKLSQSPKNYRVVHEQQHITDKVASSIRKPPPHCSNKSNSIPTPKLSNSTPFGISSSTGTSRCSNVSRSSTATISSTSHFASSSLSSLNSSLTMKLSKVTTELKHIQNEISKLPEGSSNYRAHRHRKALLEQLSNKEKELNELKKEAHNEQKRIHELKRKQREHEKQILKSHSERKPFENDHHHSQYNLKRQHSDSERKHNSQISDDTIASSSSSSSAVKRPRVKYVNKFSELDKTVGSLSIIKNDQLIDKNAKVKTWQPWNPAHVNAEDIIKNPAQFW
ncbi:MATH and LRR domain-containing protein PFE0570w-like [Episyrphus balteatus]|uniref:MATH and LRR domain-containing protein PFE0570w-like n=1 Tax=Episyrphus balteatus TaxID=286459 RepID=UPI002486B03D|nr:MATH and LRR domain-containing protein PFE0570w-like [Episyrphus balteatus]